METPPPVANVVRLVEKEQPELGVHLVFCNFLQSPSSSHFKFKVRLEIFIRVSKVIYYPEAVDHEPIQYFQNIWKFVFEESRMRNRRTPNASSESSPQDHPAPPSRTQPNDRVVMFIRRE